MRLQRSELARDDSERVFDSGTDQALETFAFLKQVAALDIFDHLGVAAPGRNLPSPTIDNAVVPTIADAAGVQLCRMPPTALASPPPVRSFCYSPCRRRSMLCAA